MWCDDFDMDLLKVFPNLPQMIRNPDRVLWTVGSTTDGRLNHPTCWNTHGAFLWLEKPDLVRDEHGWFNVFGCVGHSAEIECTWIEWLRDCWPHTYGTMVVPSQRGRVWRPGCRLLPPPPPDDFSAIMYDLRGWRKQDVSLHRKRAMQWFCRCDLILDQIVARMAA